MKRTKSKNVSQRMEVDATSPLPVGSVSVRISPDVISGEDHVVSFDAKQVEDIDENVKLFVAIGTKINPRKWVKKHESQVSERDKIKLKVIILYDSIDKEVHMTQPDRFAAEDSATNA